MRLRERERYDTLYAVRDLIHQGNWVAFDSETTSLEGEIISWAVAAPDGTILGQGFVQPTRPITEGARAIHHIAVLFSDIESKRSTPHRVNSPLALPMPLADLYRERPRWPVAAFSSTR